MPDPEVYRIMLAKGLPVDKSRYLRYDTLADSDDLSMLFEVLTSVRDSRGKPAKITPLSLVANPDYDKIINSGFNEYHYELFTETLIRYSDKHAGSFALWKEGIASGIFVPQFHGREHLNVYAWLNALKANSIEARLGFDHKMYGLNTDSYSKRKNLYMSAFEFDTEEEFSEMPGIILDGAMIFERLFGYRAKCFMAPCAIWSRRIEPAIWDAGIEVIQSGAIQYEPVSGIKTNVYNKKLRYTGQVSSYGLIFTRRNSSFEPSESDKIDWVSKSLKDVSLAFKWKKPAIISSHRVNFIGALVPANREKGLKELKRLLNELIKHWPDIEFMTSDELLTTIKAEKKGANQ
ncbi:MAG: polysaccharide (de)acetylase [Bacteroidales bacterium]|nr:polysaccharide (de)acetylase [Bacteroidales bacterium]